MKLIKHVLSFILTFLAATVIYLLYIIAYSIMLICVIIHAIVVVIISLLKDSLETTQDLYTNCNDWLFKANKITDSQRAVEEEFRNGKM